MRVPVRHCLYCSKKLDAVQSLRKKLRPKDGDPTLCISCGGWMFFTKDLDLRKPTIEEIGLLETNPDSSRVMQCWAEMKQFFGAKVQ